MPIPNPRLALLVSYSGSRSRILAEGVVGLVRESLPKLDPWLYGPEGGTRHIQDLNEVLDRVTFGIACMTPENLHSRWIHFEAGALSKLRDHGRLIPLLYRVDPEDLEPPLDQFGARTADDLGMPLLLREIAHAFGQAEPAWETADSPGPPARLWREVRAALDADTRRLRMAIDGNSAVHVQLTRLSRTIAKATTPLRQFLAHRILTQTEDAVKEIADRHPSCRTPEEFIVQVRGELRKARRARALCGGKRWGRLNRRRYYETGYRFAEAAAALGTADALVRIFVPPAGGVWPASEWDVLMEHHKRARRGVRALVLRAGDADTLPGFASVVREIIDGGVGFIMTEHEDGRGAVFSHRGGIPGHDESPDAEPFRAGEFRNRYAVEEFRRLMEALEEHSVPFVPSDWEHERLPTPAPAPAPRT